MIKKFGFAVREEDAGKVLTALLQMDLDNVELGILPDGYRPPGTKPATSRKAKARAPKRVLPQDPFLPGPPQLSRKAVSRT